jgi:alkylhydroperoxidase family enzyme
MTSLLLAALLAANAPVTRSGIPYLTDEQAQPKELVQTIQSRRPGGKLLNLDRVLLHSPNFAKGWNSMFAAIRNQLSLPGNLREIAIMAIAVLNKSDYEWIQHEPEFLKAGGTKEQLAAIKKDAAGAARNAKLFDEKERAALALTAEMTRKVTATPATMKRVRSLLPDDQVVELVGTIAGYNMVSRFVSTLGIEAEDTAPVKTSAK